MRLIDWYKQFVADKMTQGILKLQFYILSDSNQHEPRGLIQLFDTDDEFKKKYLVSIFSTNM